MLDLDGCLFDNRWRQARIFHELGGHWDEPALARIEVEHFEDWSLSRTLRNAGLDPTWIEARREAIRAGWAERFFHGDYVLHDRPMPGAVRFVRALARAGMSILYLTGRHQGMAEGTSTALRRAGFPPPPEAAALWCKPDERSSDEDWKRRALSALPRLGEPALFLDNEPCNVNAFHAAFPAALVVFVATDHSSRPDRPDPALPFIQGFLRTDEAS